jgi:hypothetical protein
MSEKNHFEILNEQIVAERLLQRDRQGRRERQRAGTSQTSATDTAEIRRKQQIEADRARVEAARAEAEAARAEQADREDERRSHIQGLFDAKKERDRRHQGTWPAEVWGDEARELCDDFLEFMADRDFPESTKLIDRRLLFNRWSTLGYGVGACALGHRSVYDTKEPIRGNNMGHNVFLCEDGQLRLFVHSTAKPHYKPSHNRRLGLNRRPSLTFDLPIHPETGDVIMPRVGHFSTRKARVSEEYEVYEHDATDVRWHTDTNRLSGRGAGGSPPGPWAENIRKHREDSRVVKTRKFDTDMDYFQEQKLEEVLASYVVSFASEVELN